MVDLLSIITTIFNLANKINELVGKIKDNREECDWLLDHIHRVSTNVALLQQMLEGTTKMSDGRHQVMSDALMGLKETLERSPKIIQDCHVKRGHFMRAIKAADAAKKLQQIRDAISSNMIEAIFATVTCSFALKTEMYMDVKKLVQAVHARDTASIRSKLPSLSKQIAEALPNLPTTVTESVEIYSTSIRYRKNEMMEANRTNVHSSVKTTIENNNVLVEHRTSLASLSDGNEAAMATQQNGGSSRSIRPSPSKSYGNVAEIATRQNEGSSTHGSIRLSLSKILGNEAAKPTQKNGGSSRSIRASISKSYGNDATMNTRQNGGSSNYP